MEFFHVLNRGVDKRDVVLNDDDRQRFVRSLFLFNDSKASPNAVSQPARVDDVNRKRDILVHIHAWCLMNNHYHLLLSPIDDDPFNLSRFMKKLNMGYAKFFNEKYERTGALWQGKYKKVPISRGAHFLYIPYYLHLNPLDYSFPEWRSGRVANFDGALDALERYRWSSYLDYQGIKNFPSIISKTIKETLSSHKNQQRVMQDIISSSELAISSVKLET